MNEKSTPQNQSEIKQLPIDRNPAVVDFLHLDKSPKAVSTYELENTFRAELEEDIASGDVAADLRAISTRSKERYDSVNDRHPKNVGKKALIGAGVAGAALVVGYMGGLDARDEQKLSEYDKNNQIENVANNPQIFGELPENPSDMTINTD